MYLLQLQVLLRKVVNLFLRETRLPTSTSNTLVSTISTQFHPLLRPKVDQANGAAANAISRDKVISCNS